MERSNIAGGSVNQTTTLENCLAMSTKAAHTSTQDKQFLSWVCTLEKWMPLSTLEVQSVTVTNCKQSKSPPTVEEINIMDIQTIKYTYQWKHKPTNKLQQPIWTNLTVIMLSERSQTQRSTHWSKQAKRISGDRGQQRGYPGLSTNSQEELAEKLYILTWKTVIGVYTYEVSLS